MKDIRYGGWFKLFKTSLVQRFTSKKIFTFDRDRRNYLSWLFEAKKRLVCYGDIARSDPARPVLKTLTGR
jgi:hypothetical protein